MLQWVFDGDVLTRVDDATPAFLKTARRGTPEWDKMLLVQERAQVANGGLFPIFGGDGTFQWAPYLQPLTSPVQEAQAAQRARDLGAQLDRSSNAFEAAEQNSFFSKFDWAGPVALIGGFATAVVASGAAAAIGSATTVADLATPYALTATAQTGTALTGAESSSFSLFDGFSSGLAEDAGLTQTAFEASNLSAGLSASGLPFSLSPSLPVSPGASGGSGGSASASSAAPSLAAGLPAASSFEGAISKLIGGALGTGVASILGNEQTKQDATVIAGEQAAQAAANANTIAKVALLGLGGFFIYKLAHKK